MRHTTWISVSLLALALMAAGRPLLDAQLVGLYIADIPALVVSVMMCGGVASLLLFPELITEFDRGRVAPAPAIGRAMVWLISVAVLYQFDHTTIATIMAGCGVITFINDYLLVFEFRQHVGAALPRLLSDDEDCVQENLCLALLDLGQGRYEAWFLSLSVVVMTLVLGCLTYFYTVSWAEIIGVIALAFLASLRAMEAFARKRGQEAKVLHLTQMLNGKLSEVSHVRDSV